MSTDGTFNKSIPKLTLVASGFTGATTNPVFTTPLFIFGVRAIGYASQLSNGIGSISLPSIESLGVNNDSLDLPALNTEAAGLTGTISRTDLPFTQLRALITSAQGLTSSNATSALTLPKLLVSGNSNTFANLTLKPIAIVATGETGQDGFAVLFTKKLSLMATGSNDNQASGSPQLRPLTVSASIVNGTDAQSSKRIPRLTLVANGLTGTINQPQVITLPVITIDAEGVAQSIGTASISLPALELAVSALENIADSYDANSACYVMNTSTNAMTEYTNFGFNSFAHFNGKVIAANDGGIFELLGTDDNGADIEIEASTGTLDFGSEQLKRMDNLYVGYRSDGDLNVQIIVDGDESYDYTLGTQGNDGIYTNRLKLGKGMKGRYFQIKIDGVAVSMELDSLTVDPVVLSRKVS